MQGFHARRIVRPHGRLVCRAGRAPALRDARAAARLLAAALAAFVAPPSARPLAAATAAATAAIATTAYAMTATASPTAAAIADTAGAPRLLALTPARAGGLLVCDVATAGLPGERIVSSLRSGLVSAIDLQLEVLDHRERVVAGNRLTLRLAFDLWEEIFAVENDGGRRPFADLAALQGFLAELRALPVAPLASLSALGGDARLRLRAGLSLHPVAPSEIARVGEAIGVDASDAAAPGGGGQEVSVGLGRLIRLFYRGESDRAEPAARAVSNWFRLEELRDAPD